MRRLNPSPAVYSVERLQLPLSTDIERRWDELVEEADIDRLFASRSWYLLWYSHFCQSPTAEILLLACKAPSGLVTGIFPFVVWHPRQSEAVLVRRRLQLAGNFWQGPAGMRTEYGDFAIAPNHMEESIQAVADYLDREIAWDDFILQDMNQYSLSLRSLLECLKQAAHVRFVGNVLHDQAGSIGVTGSLTTYIASLGQGTRRRLFGLRRKLESGGPVSLEYADRETAADFLGDLNRLHAARWGRPVFEDKRLDFHIEVAARMAEQGQLMLSRMRQNGNIISVLYNVMAGSVEYNLQGGFDESSVAKGIPLGYLHTGFAIERAFGDARVKKYDLLAGIGKSEAFKHRFCTESRQLQSFQLLRRGLRSRVYGAHDRINRRRNVPSEMRSATVVATAAGNPTGYTTARGLFGKVGRLIGVGTTSGSPHSRSRYWNEYHALVPEYEAILNGTPKKISALR